jgi:hypothetical protein
MKALLKMDPQDRLSDEKAIQHPYFDGLREKDQVSSPQYSRSVRSSQSNYERRSIGKQSNNIVKQNQMLNVKQQKKIA